jgi:hypothetical protein
LLAPLADPTGYFSQPSEAFTPELSTESVTLLVVGYDYGGN